MNQFGAGLFELLAVASPEISRGEDGNDFKVDQVCPAADPSVQQFRMQRFHDLETASARGIDPARVVGGIRGEDEKVGRRSIPQRLKLQREASRYVGAEAPTPREISSR
jgi:hypothetical protein